MLYGFVEICIVFGMSLWLFSRITVTASSSEHMQAAKISLYSVTIIAVVIIVFAGILEALKFVPVGKGVARNYESFSGDLKLNAVSPDNLKFSIPVKITTGWGEKRENLPLTKEVLIFFEALLADPEFLRVQQLLFQVWKIENQNEMPFISSVIDISTLKMGEFDSFREKLAETSSHPPVPWHWLREAFERSRGKSDFHEEFFKESFVIASRYIGKAELIEDKKSDLAMGMKFEKMKADAMKNYEVSEADKPLLAFARYDSFFPQALNLLKVARNLPKNKF